jgi:competence protein ComEA
MNKFYFFLKTHLGFSSKESRGFLLLIPFMFLLTLMPAAIRYFKNLESEKLYREYQSQLDSLEKSGFALISSPLPTFNPDDTLKSPQVHPTINPLKRIPFSEADSSLLQIVPGIGPALAGRIIKRKEALGGFVSPNQLSEIYGLKQETIDKIWEFFDFDRHVFRKIPINHAIAEELAKHPYISYSEAKVLVAFRNQHGFYQSSEDLGKIKIFQIEWIEKISPYLDFGK